MPIYTLVMRDSDKGKVELIKASFNKSDITDHLKDIITFVKQGYVVDEFSDYYLIHYSKFKREYWVQHYALVP